MSRMRRKRIHLPSRYSEVSSYLVLTDERNTYEIQTNSYTIRVIFGNEKKTVIKAIDLEGGPMISEGDTLICKGYKIKEIKDVDHKYKVIFEKINEDKR